jgi:DoxX-like family
MHTNMRNTKNIFTLFIAMVWLANGLFCKLLNLVPRHQLIVAKILGSTHAVLITKAIGVLELLMVVWVLSKIKSNWCAILQILVVLTMNIMEFVLVPDILLFGKLNLLVAVLFALLIYYNEFMNQQKDAVHV